MNNTSTSTLPPHAVPNSGGRLRGAVDPQRPIYHFLPPANWLNDPNGLIQWKGRYHLFYQYNPNGPFHGTIHWGHAASDDLVHWRDLPVALAPTPGGPDADGCWSGCAVDDNGVPTLIYTGVQGRAQRPCVATSHDDLLTWEKYPGNPVIAAPPPELSILEGVHFRDHSVWKEDGSWYMLIGTGITDAGGAVLLYRSQDLRTWEYLHPLAASEPGELGAIFMGSMWECADFFPIGDRHALIVSIWDQRRLHYPVWTVGTYREQRFTSERRGYVDLGRTFYAPQSMTDDRGRRIMWGWLRESRSLEAQLAAGWAGVISLPRVLSLLPDRTLGMQPAPELQRLRGAHYGRADVELAGEVLVLPPEAHGAAIEIIAEWEIGDAAEVGLLVRRSPEGAEETAIVFDRTRARLRVDRSRSSKESGNSLAEVEGPFDLAEDERLRLQVFLDASAVEIFANGRACLSTRIYPAGADSLGVAAFASGGRTRLTTLDVWQMAAIWLADQERSLSV